MRLRSPRRSSTQSGRSVGPLDQRAATRQAREHPAVIEARERLHDYLRKDGIENPADPRWVLTARGGDKAVHSALSAAHLRLFDRVRGMLMQGTTESDLADV